jgi:hypothetical protein
MLRCHAAASSDEGLLLLSTVWFVWLQGSLYGYTGLEMDNLQTLVSSTNELADTLRAVRLPVI